MTEYVSLGDISELQIKIMQFVDVWVRTEKTPVPKKEIVKEMKLQKHTKYPIRHALEGLVDNHYLRKAIIGPDQPLNEVLYVQIRRV